MCVLYVGVLKCASAVRAGYKSGERDHAGQPHLELQTLQVGSFMCWVEPVCVCANTQTTSSSPVIAVLVRISALALTFNSACFLQQLTKCVLENPFVYTSVCWSTSVCTQSLDTVWLRLWKYLAQCAKLQMLCLLTTLHISCNNKQIGGGSLRGWQNPALSRCGFILKVLLCVWCLLS